MPYLAFYHEFANVLPSGFNRTPPETGIIDVAGHMMLI